MIRLVAQSCLTLCDPMDCSMSGFLVLLYIPEFAQTRVHWVDDAIQPFHSLLPPSPPALNLSQHQGLFQWVTSDGQCFGATSSASVLPVNIKDWFLLGLVGLISLLSKGLSRVISSTTIQKHPFFGPQPSLWSKFHMHNWKTIDLTRWIFVSKVMSLLLNTLSTFVLAFLPRS